MLDAIIIKGVAGSYTVRTAEPQPRLFTCTARGVFRNRNTTPLVGDNVLILPANNNTATIQTILPRKNQLRRPPAANISQVIITVATQHPPFNSGLLDRFLIIAEHDEIPVLICINKHDLAPNCEESFRMYRDAGYTLVFASAKTGYGLDTLLQKMAGEVNLFAGPSGVGKSSLLNALSPTLALETGGLSCKIGRGKHTTRHTEIFPLGKSPTAGYCFDTPGFTSLDITHIPKTTLPHLFPEFSPHIPHCKFNNCSHIRENHCAVKEQINKTIHAFRYETYAKLMEGGS